MVRNTDDITGLEELEVAVEVVKTENEIQNINNKKQKNKHECVIDYQVVNCGTLNVRQKNNINSPVIHILDRKDIVFIFDSAREVNGFLQINGIQKKNNGEKINIVGFVLANFIEKV